jgi:hypothetical protein
MRLAPAINDGRPRVYGAAFLYAGFEPLAG